MKKNLNRRTFIRSSALAGMGASLHLNNDSFFALNTPPQLNTRVGIIGVDTSHSIAFTKALNDANANPEFGSYRIVAAYPKGSNDIESSTSRIPANTEELKKYGVRIVDSIEQLLKEVDVVMLETNDGRLHLEQALPVLKAGKRMFIDKPVAASLKDAVAIYVAAAKYKVPVFSASSLRYMRKAQEVLQGKSGRVLGADTYSPATIEKTHPDLFWYGIHGVELLLTVMGKGCKSVVRFHTPDTDVVVGTWADNRIGTFRGTRTGPHSYGGTVFTEKTNEPLGAYEGYNPLLTEIVKFFQSGVSPLKDEETLEIFAFMEAAEESKRTGGRPVTLESVMKKAMKQNFARL